jgi:predicted phosphodiesterase
MAVYVCADLHGHLEIYKKIKAMLKPEDKVFCLGDCGDRGPDSWATIKAVYADPQFIYIKGNHEDMLVKACKDYLIDDCMWDYGSYALCCHNGGRDTLEGWELDPNREEWFRRLRDLPTWETYENSEGKVFVLCHAGFTPWFKAGTTECEIPTDQDLLWDREHIYSQTYLPKHMDDVIVVHGHTPIHYLSADLSTAWESGAFWYCDNHKVCIDSGGFFSGEWVLLNLDTLEETVIELDHNDQMCI